MKKIDKDHLFTETLVKARVSKNIGKLLESVQLYREAISIKSDNYDAVSELGIVLWEQGELDEAAKLAKKLILIDKDHPNGYTLLAHISMDQFHYNQSIELYQKAIALYQENSELYGSFALAYKESSRFEEAYKAYIHALLIEPNNAEVHFNFSILCLMLGDYSTGFNEYEWRKQKREKYGLRHSVKPEWSGESLNGKTLLIHHEQGLGDAIQFSRYVQLLKNWGVNLVYEPHPSLIGLLESMQDIVVLDDNQTSSNFDYHCPLLSLPLRLGTRIETVPANIPYLSAEKSRIDRWRMRLGEKGFKIGVAWMGSGGRFSKNRLFPVTCLDMIGEIEGVRLIGLHKQPWQIPHGMAIEMLGSDFDDGKDAFLDTAAVIECCDLVISCDTAIAHLAGAMGKPCWIVLRHIPHWVWMIDRTDSPWFPSVRLFRQKIPGDWAGVFMDLKSELNDYIRTQRTLS